MKKTAALLLTLCLCINLFACGSENANTTEPHSHTYSEWQTVTAANCTTAGLEERTCSCGEKETKTSPETGHTFSEWTTTIPANCTAAGLEERACSCGEKESRSIAALGHSTESGICERCYTAVGMSASEIQKYLVLAGVNVEEPNSAGGCEVTIAYRNTSSKPIKYLTFHVTPYNAVFDPVYCEVRRESLVKLQITGPIYAGHANYYDWNNGNYYYYLTADDWWSNVWYNYSITYVHVNKIIIEYMDGTFLYINEDLIPGCYIPCEDNHI